jgi:phage baseplate assembly protein W
MATRTIGFTLPLQRSSGGIGGYFGMSHTVMEQIKSNFINLVSTMKGERLSNPEFGCDIHKSLFNFNDANIDVKTGPWIGAREAVEEAVAKYMPFIELDRFEIETTDGDRDRYTVRVYMSYTLTGTNLSDEALMQYHGM